MQNRGKSKISIDKIRICDIIRGTAVNVQKRLTFAAE
jgi:hypothetical protein